MRKTEQDREKEQIITAIIALAWVGTGLLYLLAVGASWLFG